jgi:hypothetical protein
MRSVRHGSLRQLLLPFAACGVMPAANRASNL